MYMRVSRFLTALENGQQRSSVVIHRTNTWQNKINGKKGSQEWDMIEGEKCEVG